MRPTDKIGCLIKETKYSADAATRNRILDDAQAAMAKTQGMALTEPAIWRIIMKSPITKFAVAAVIMIAIVFSISVIDKSVPTAFGIEQTIEAYNSIHFLHVKVSSPNKNEPLEYWIKADPQGRIEKARYYLPEYCAPEDGAKLITWTPEKAELWFKRKGSYLIFQSKKIETMVRPFIMEAQPKLVMEQLLEKQKAGSISIDTQKPQDKQKPIAITVTSKNGKTVYNIDQATNLITDIETYSINDGNEVLLGTTEYYDYNVPIDDNMFTLKNEVPKDVTMVDQLNQLIGIPQGTMTYEQAAVETVRQFFQALIDKDYKKAGLIYSGVSEEKAKEYFGKLNVTAIISVGPATPYPQCGEHSFEILVEYEITDANGNKSIRKQLGPKARCGDDEMHPDRWIIHGGI